MANKDKWDILDILLKGFMPAALIFISFETTNFIKKQESLDANRRLYTEIATSREQAESSLRKEMFSSVIKTFLTPSDGNTPPKLEEQVLAIQMLAYNFHEVIDLGPLFKYVAKKTDKADSKTQQFELKKQLLKAASEVIEKQLAALQTTIPSPSIFVDFKELEGNRSLEYDNHTTIKFKTNEGLLRYIKLEPLRLEDDNSGIEVRLESGLVTKEDNSKNNESDPDIDIIFSVSPFDFPMIDNTRLPNSYRIAVVVSRWVEDQAANLKLVYFPASRASLKEKLYYEELTNQMLTAGMTHDN